MQLSNNSRIIYGPWIGLDDRTEPGILRWRDGKALDRSDFQMWAPGQPMLIDNDGKYNIESMAFGRLHKIISAHLRTTGNLVCAMLVQYVIEKHCDIFRFRKLCRLGL